MFFLCCRVLIVFAVDRWRDPNWAGKSTHHHEPLPASRSTNNLPPLNTCVTQSHSTQQPRRRRHETCCVTQSMDLELPLVERLWLCWKTTTTLRMGPWRSRMFFDHTWEARRSLSLFDPTQRLTTQLSFYKNRGHPWPPTLVCRAFVSLHCLTEQSKCLDTTRGHVEDWNEK